MNHRKLRQLSARLLRLRDEERRHIARELHDVIGQNLAAMTINLDFLLTSADRLAPQARQALRDSEALARQTAKEVRTFSYLLHPPLFQTTDEVQLEVRDAGRGFVPKSSESAEPAPPLGVGIPGMQERLRQLGGRLHLSSSIDGTIVRATLPCVRKRKGNQQ